MLIGLTLYRVLTLGVGIVENLFYSGLMFGWASLVFILKREGYYSHLCASVNASHDPSALQVNASARLASQPLATAPPSVFDEGEEEGFPSCQEQDAELQLVFTVASFCYEFLLFPMGLCWDQFGTLVMRLFCCSLIFIGLLLIAFSSIENPHFLYPACCFLTVGGLELMITSLQISNLFGRRKSTVMTILSGCLDSSAFVLVFIKLGYDTLGISLQTSFLMLASGCLIFLLNIFLLPKKGHIPYPLPSDYRQRKLQTAEGEEHHLQTGLEMVDVSKSDTNAAVKDATPSQNITEALKDQRYPSLCSCMVSWPAFCLFVWFSLLQLNFFFFISTFNSEMERLTGGNLTIVSRYTTILAIYQGCSIFVAPLCGILLDRNRTKTRMTASVRGPYDDLLDSRLVFALTTCLYIVFNITLLIDIVELRYFSFLLHIITRSFMYSLVVTGCALFFPVKYFGSTSGLIESSASLVGLLQKPMFSIQQIYLDNQSFWLFIGLIGLNLVTLLLPIYIHFDVKRSLKAQQREEAQNGSNASSS